MRERARERERESERDRERECWSVCMWSVRGRCNAVFCGQPYEAREFGIYNGEAGIQELVGFCPAAFE